MHVCTQMLTKTEPGPGLLAMDMLVKLALNCKQVYFNVYFNNQFKNSNKKMLTLARCQRQHVKCKLMLPLLSFSLQVQMSKANFP